MQGLLSLHHAEGSDDGGDDDDDGDGGGGGSMKHSLSLSILSVGRFETLLLEIFFWRSIFPRPCYEIDTLRRLRSFRSS